MYKLIASKIATLTATMIKKNFPILGAFRRPNAKQQEWFPGQRANARLAVVFHVRKAKGPPSRRALQING